MNKDYMRIDFPTPRTLVKDNTTITFAGTNIAGPLKLPLECEDSLFYMMNTAKQVTSVIAPRALANKYYWFKADDPTEKYIDREVADIQQEAEMSPEYCATQPMGRFDWFLLGSTMALLPEHFSYDKTVAMALVVAEDLMDIAEDHYEG